MGISVMRLVMAQYLRSIGVPTDPLTSRAGIVDVAGRMYLDLTPWVRYRPARKRLPESMRIYGPRVAASLARVLDDPRFAPLPGRPFRLRVAITVAARVVPGLVIGIVGALARPGRARGRAFRAWAHPQLVAGAATARIRSRPLRAATG